jgi:SAM-dependent methyltransferase
MHYWLLNHLICLVCKHGPFELVIEREEKDQVMEGALLCPSCERTYPIHKGIPRFVDSESYVDTFSFQRRAVRKHWDYYTTEDSAERSFPNLTPIPIEEYRKGVLLDAGCGYGRWVRFFSDRGVRVVGVDLSTDSIELCAREYLGRENVGLIQADVCNLPFPQDHFANIFSFGVLHHTPDTKAALGCLAEHLTPGGNISIFVYHQSSMTDAYRKVARKLPMRLLYALLVFHHYAIMSWMRHLGPIRVIYNQLIPSATYKEAWHRVHDDFDRYSPVYAHRNTYPTVYGWFRDLGMEDIRLTKQMISITARKPVAGPAIPRDS